MAIFTNQATLSYNNTITNSNVAVGELVEVLSITKTAVSADYSAGDNVTYVISIVNSGATAFSNLTLTDDLGGYPFGTDTVYPLSYVDGSARYYINGALQSAPTVTAGPPMIIGGINVPAGGNVTLVYEAEITQYAPLSSDGEITNTASLAGGGVSTALSASETITAASDSSLTITKSISPQTVTENSLVTYTFVIQNTGNTPIVATDNATVTDVFNPILTDLAVSFNGVAWTSPANYTYNEATGEFETVAGEITVPAATFAQDAETGAWIVTPGVSILTVTGTI